jgi:hypothetical protein
VPDAQQECREADIIETAKCGLFYFPAILLDIELLIRRMLSSCSIRSISAFTSRSSFLTCCTCLKKQGSELRHGTQCILILSPDRSSKASTSGVSPNGRYWPVEVLQDLKSFVFPFSAPSFGS